MSRFWKRGREPSELEARLRASRPEPRSDFVNALGERITQDAKRPPARPLRLALATVITIIMLVSLASVGGLGYAASGAKQAFNGAKSVVASSGPKSKQRKVTPADHQYKPGKGCGSKNHSQKPKDGTGSAKKPCGPQKP